MVSAAPREIAPVVGPPRDVAILMLAAGLYSFNFTMLLPVTPVLVDRQGGRGIAGLVNTALLLATVLMQWASPLVLRHFTKKVLFIVGLALMGLPAFAYIVFSTSVTAIFVASAFRGAGFGILTVVSAALVLELSPAHRRGRVLGQFGLATSIPGIFGPAVGLQLMSAHSGAWPSALGAAVCIVAAGLLCMVRQPWTRTATHGADNAMPRTAVLRMLRNPELRGFAVAFTLVSVAWGGTTSFLPLALTDVGPGSAASFLLISGLVRALGRWLAGLLADRGMSPAASSVPIVFTMAFGLALLAIDDNPAVIIASAVIYGSGLGLLQTMLFLAIIRRSPYGHGAAAALWSTSLDIGGVLGTSVLAGVAALWGYSAVLWAMPAIMLLALPFLLKRRQAERRVDSPKMPASR
jgi:predicted MFS family arabinose efflux permease